MRYEVHLVSTTQVEAYTTVEADSLEDAERLADALTGSEPGLDWEKDPDAPLGAVYAENVYPLPPLPERDTPPYAYRPKEKPPVDD